MPPSASSAVAEVSAEGGQIRVHKVTVAVDPGVVVNPDGVVKTAEIHDNAIARDVKETLRKLKAAKYVATNPGQVCPARWQEGAKTIAPSLDLVGKI